MPFFIAKAARKENGKNKMAKRILIGIILIFTTAICTICATMRYTEVCVKEDVVEMIFLGNVWEKCIESN